MNELTAESLSHVARELLDRELLPRDFERLVPLLNALRVEMRALGSFDCAGTEPLTEWRLERWTS